MGLFACSGPGAGAAIAESIYLGYAHAAAVGVLLSASVLLGILRRQWAVPLLLGALLMLHPAWTISATSGDCGCFKHDASWFVTWLCCAGLSWQAVCAAWRVSSR